MTIRPLFLDKASVAEMLSLSETTIEKLVRLNDLPTPGTVRNIYRQAGWTWR